MLLSLRSVMSLSPSSSFALLLTQPPASFSLSLLLPSSFYITRIAPLSLDSLRECEERERSSLSLFLPVMREASIHPSVRSFVLLECKYSFTAGSAFDCCSEGVQLIVNSPSSSSQLLNLVDIPTPVITSMVSRTRVVSRPRVVARTSPTSPMK